MSKRKILDVRLSDHSLYDLLDGRSLDDVGLELHRLKCQFEGRDVYFSLQPYGYDGGVDLELRERRLETDAEFEKRQAANKKARDKKRLADAAKKDKEYAEFLRLKKKFGES